MSGSFSQAGSQVVDVFCYSSPVFNSILDGPTKMLSRASDSVTR